MEHSDSQQHGIRIDLDLPKKEVQKQTTNDEVTTDDGKQ